MLDPVDTTIALMQIDSTSGREGEVMAWVESLLAGRGWSTTRIPVTPGRDDILAVSGSQPRVTLSTHLDTVPPYIAPRLEGSVLHGRGACDAKGIAAAMICAGERLRARDVPVALLFVVGEEVSHDGAHAADAFAAANGTPSRILINGEPTEGTLGVGTKGAVRVTVRTHGEAAHSAYPQLGRSATHSLVHLLAELDTIPWPADSVLGDTTVNIGHLAGGVADNVVAPWAEARLMFRLVTPLAAVKPLVERWAARRATLDWGVHVEPVHLSTVPGFPTSVVAFATDIPALGHWGTPLLFGPGSIHVAHRDDESVRVADLRAAVDAYERIADAALLTL